MLQMHKCSGTDRDSGKELKIAAMLVSCLRRLLIRRKQLILNWASFLNSSKDSVALYFFYFCKLPLFLKNPLQCVLAHEL